jgi:hypothetical protein
MPDLLKGGLEMPKVESSPEPDEVALETQAIEQAAKKKEKEAFLEHQAKTLETKIATAKEAQPATAAAPVVVQKDEVIIEVEKVLEEGLGDFFGTLPPEAQQKFKEKGEEASTKIAEMVRSLKINFKEALRLVRDWLLTIPKVNKFFLEQEAKMKVDKINLLIQMKKEEMQNKP